MPEPLWPPVASRLSRVSGISTATCLVVGVSGGVDSIVLSHLLKGRLKRISPARLHLAHLDHGLRGADSTADAAFVVAFAERLGVTATVERIAVGELAGREGRNLEAVARRERYDFFLRVAREVGAGFVATGHTQSDQAETVLLRILRGASPDGAAGILPERPLGEGAVRVVRPLLDVTRAEILDYARRHDLEFREDATNADVSFARNRLRHDILPRLEGINPDAVGRLAEFAEQAAEDAAWFLRETEGWLAKNMVLIGTSVVLPVSELCKLEPVFRRRVIYRALQSSTAPAVAALHVRKIDTVLLAADGIGKSLDLPGGRIARRERLTLIFSPPGDLGEAG